MSKARHSETSVPAANARTPAPVNTTVLTDGSALNSRQTTPIRSYIANVSALRACGRLSVSQTIWPESPRRSSSSSGSACCAASSLIPAQDPLGLEFRDLRLCPPQRPQHFRSVLAQPWSRPPLSHRRIREMDRGADLLDVAQL